MLAHPIEQKNKQPPYFSIVILCWNSSQYLLPCLDSLATQTFRDFEILVVDNGSLQPVTTAGFANYADLTIHFYALEHNIGFAAGNNFAASRANGKYLVLLNSDAFPFPDWLENIHAGIQKYPNCFFASKLIKAKSPERLDGEGDVYHASGLVWRKSHNSLNSTSHNQEKEEFSACAAAAVYPMDAFCRVDGFDPDYFSYSEDSDLGFRLRLVGYKCIYLPNAVVSHVGSGSTERRSDFSVYYGQRNLIWTFFKDMPGFLVWLLAPFHLLSNALMILLSFFRKQGKVTLKAKKDAFLKLGDLLRKREKVQKTRTVPIYKLMLAMDWNPLSPLLKLIVSR